MSERLSDLVDTPSPQALASFVRRVCLEILDADCPVGWKGSSCQGPMLERAERMWFNSEGKRIGRRTRDHMPVRDDSHLWASCGRKYGPDDMPTPAHIAETVGERDLAVYRLADLCGHACAAAEYGLSMRQLRSLIERVNARLVAMFLEE